MKTTIIYFSFRRMLERRLRTVALMTMPPIGSVKGVGTGGDYREVRIRVRVKVMFSCMVMTKVGDLGLNVHLVLNRVALKVKEENLTKPLRSRITSNLQQISVDFRPLMSVSQI